MKATVRYRGVERKVLPEDFLAVRGLVAAIYGMTPYGSPQKLAAKWALDRAAELAVSLRLRATRELDWEGR